MSSQMPDEAAFKLFKFACAANDSKLQFWPKENVEYARMILTRRHGYVPSIEEIATEIDVDRAM